MRRFRYALAGLLTAATLALGQPAAAQEGASDALADAASAIEARLGARIGVSVVDTGSGARRSYRADERFPLNSTFKAYACAGLLARVDAGAEALDRRVAFAPVDLVSHSPVTERLAGGPGMTLGELCEATMTVSDNTAANLVLASLGGPEGFTAFMRSLGDGATRIDRWETALNETRPGDPRDTTTPAAAAESLKRLVLGDVLSEPSRAQFRHWLAGNRVSGPLIRAALPDGWAIGDRSGGDRHGSRSVVAVLWPPGRAPVVAAIYLAGTDIPMDTRNAAIAEMAAVVVDLIGR